MTTLREAARDALLAWDANSDSTRTYNAMDALRAALATPEPTQEPVVCNPADYCACQHQPLYAHPAPPQTPMTERDARVAARCQDRHQAD
jgi:hypothetical protein